MESETVVCRVCEQPQLMLYPVANCRHRFCQQCSISYIASQASNFSAAVCLQEGCGASLDKTLPIYQHLDPQTLLQLQKYDTYLFLLENPQFIGCKAQDCSGVLRLKQGRCSTCHATHCKKCAGLQHQGPCVQTEEEREMQKLSYRKCPTCRVWVQKVAGCQYIHCKCKTQFCFRCGNQFSRDPCRKRSVWQKQAQIRALQSQLQIRCPKSIKSFLVLVPRLILAFLILIPVTALFSLVPLLALTVAILIGLFLPIAFCQPASSIQTPGLRKFTMLMLVVFYPVLSALSMLFLVLMVLLYPFLRNKNHHGAYDPFDIGLSFLAFYYLKFTIWLINCCSE